jgi:hypothetical protein
VRASPFRTLRLEDASAARSRRELNERRREGKRDEDDEWWEQWRRKREEDDERDEQLHEDIKALLKKVQDRHKGEDDDDGIGVRVPV